MNTLARGSASRHATARALAALHVHKRKWMTGLVLALGVLSPPLPAISGLINWGHDGAFALRLPQPDGYVVLSITGAIDRANHDGEAHFDMAMLDNLPVHTLHTSTVVTDGVRRFDGILMRELLQYVGARGQTVQARALNNYAVDIPVSDFTRYDVLLATHMDGKRLNRADKGPFWIIYPRDHFKELQDIRYDYRWVWQLRQLTIR